MSPRSQKSQNELESPVTEVPVEPPARHVFVQCPGCRRIIDKEKLEEALDVCPRCGTHLRIGSRRRLELTIDEGSFAEWDATLSSVDFLDFPDYAQKLEDAAERSGERDAVICGRASIDGHDCVVFVMEGDFMMGSMGSVVGEKICRAFERATELALPVVGFTVSGGARMQEGVTSLMQMAKVSGAVRRHSDRGLLYLAVLTDPTTGGVTASFAMEGDLILAEPGALVAFAGPRVVEQTTHKKLPQGFQRAEFLLEHGFVDLIVSRRELPATIGELLSLHAGLAPAADAPHALAAPVDHSALPMLKRFLGLGQGDARRGPDEGTSPYERVKGARSSRRPTPLELVERAFDGFVELHGDRLFGEDGAVVGGIAWTGGRVVTVIMTERGRSTKERVERNFGSPNPEGYRKAGRLMRQAQKFGRPVVCLVDTSGAYPGIGAEERGQGEAIASDLVQMGALTVPAVTCIVGEGGSGGALALAVSNRVLMLSGAVYSVISPESCSTILWRSPKRVEDAAAALRLTAEDLLELGIVDGVIEEEGLEAGELAQQVLAAVGAALDELQDMTGEELEDQRYRRFRAMGRTSEGEVA